MPPSQRQALRRLFLALPSYAGAMLLMYSGAWLNLFPWEQAHVVASFAATGLFGFWLLLRSGATLRWRDPMAVLPQTIFSVLVLALTYHLIEVSRSVTLLWLAVIVIYDMRRLPIRHVIWVIATATTCQLLNFASIWSGTQDPGVRIDELMNLGCMALLLPTLAYVSANARATVKRRKQQNQEMAQTLEALGFLSVHDSLTGLHNRRRMLESLQQEARKARRFKRPFVVAVLDIDHFKRVNDGHGHAVGDAVLKAFASLVAAEFSGPVDASARWGGEEFVVMMPETDAALACQRLQALRDCVHAFDWSTIRPGLRVTFSAGMAEYRSGTVAQLIDQADQALYEAKHQGRDRVLPHIEPDAALAGVRAAHVERATQLRLSSPAVADSAAARWQQALAQDIRRKGKPPLRGTRDPIGWVAWVLGPDRAIRKQMQMVLISSAMYLFWLSAVLFHAIPNQLFPTWLNVLLVTHITLGAVVPPLLIRSGWSQRLKDPGLVAEQIIWSCAMLVAGYTFSPQGKGAILAVLCQAMVFSFGSVSVPRARQLGVSVIAMLSLAWVGLATWGHLSPDQLSTEGLRIAMACSVLLLLTLQSQHFSRFRDQARQEREKLTDAIEQVRRLTTTDALTGLSNRQHLHEVLEHESERNTRHHRGLCLALVDLDHFKHVNDTLGHQVGDEVLAGFAQLARQAFRDVDTVGRWGGEEFLIVMPGGSQVGPQRLLEQVAGVALSTHAPELRVTFSAGLALHVSGEPWEATLERADQALYAAKREGRNRCLEAAVPA